MEKFIIILLLTLYGIITLAMCIIYYHKIIIDKKPKNKIHFYVARDKDGSLWIYLGKPFRVDTEFHYDQNKKVFCLTYNIERLGLKREDFDSLKWEDEPVEVFLNLEEYEKR